MRYLLLLLIIVGCNPTARVLRDNEKTKYVFNESLRRGITSCIVDTTFVFAPGETWDTSELKPHIEYVYVPAEYSTDTIRIPAVCDSQIAKAYKQGYSQRNKEIQALRLRKPDTIYVNRIDVSKVNALTKYSDSLSWRVKSLETTVSENEKNRKKILYNLQALVNSFIINPWFWVIIALLVLVLLRKQLAKFIPFLKFLK